MSHFAEVIGGVVTRVIVADQAFIDSEQLGPKENWIQTSYNTNKGKHSRGKTQLRKNFASRGYTYDAQKDEFIPPKPGKDWLLDEGTGRWYNPKHDKIITDAEKVTNLASEIIIKKKIAITHTNNINESNLVLDSLDLIPLPDRLLAYVDILPEDVPNTVTMDDVLWLETYQVEKDQKQNIRVETIALSNLEREIQVLHDELVTTSGGGAEATSAMNAVIKNQEGKI